MGQANGGRSAGVLQPCTLLTRCSAHVQGIMATAPNPNETITSPDGIVFDVYYYFDTSPAQNAKVRGSSNGMAADQDICMSICTYNKYGAFVQWEPSFTWRNFGRILPWAPKYAETCFRWQSPAECRANLRPVKHWAKTFIPR